MHLLSLKHDQSYVCVYCTDEADDCKKTGPLARFRTRRPGRFSDIVRTYRYRYDLPPYTNLALSSDHLITLHSTEALAVVVVTGIRQTIDL